VRISNNKAEVDSQKLTNHRMANVVVDFHKRVDRRISSGAPGLTIAPRAPHD
jgi:hypothetical protein